MKEDIRKELGKQGAAMERGQREIGGEKSEAFGITTSDGAIGK